MEPHLPFPYDRVLLPAFLRGHREKRSGLLVDVFAATLRTLDLAFFVFRKAQDDFERLLARSRTRSGA
jgi:hypothetical protein